MIIFSVKKVLLIVFISLFFVSLVFNAWLGYQLLSTINIYEAQEMNIKILDFTDMFVEKILMADKEIDFDTRLALESTVRNLGDQQISIISAISAIGTTRAERCWPNRKKK